MKRIDNYKIINKNFGRLTVINEAPKIKNRRAFHCVCKCGKYITVRLSYLRSGDTKSCGCLARDIIVKRSTKHGLTPFGVNPPKEYHIWASMIQRCENIKDKSYKYYGGRNIKVSKRWHDFRNFINDMGWRKNPNTSIDRINNDGNYTKSNCRWATRKEQMNNTRANKKLTLNI